jgi:DNA modification methylase
MAEGYKAYSKEFTKENNDFPIEFTNKIINANSLDILKQLPDNCVDLVFTSPPYNFGMGYDTHNDKTDWPKYFEMLWSIFDECIRVVKHGGRIIVNTQPLFC